MGIFLDILWWMIYHWAEITAGVLVLDKIVTVTPNKFDDVILTFIKWIIKNVKYLKDKIKSLIFKKTVDGVTKKDTCCGGKDGKDCDCDCEKTK